MYEKFREFDIPFPKTTIIKTFDAESSILKKINEHNFPILIKEHFGNHSKGIFHISNIEEFKIYLKSLEIEKYLTLLSKNLLMTKMTIG